jgi:hypothetical protein
MACRGVVSLFVIAFLSAGASAGLAAGDAGLFLRYHQAQGDKAVYAYSCGARAQLDVQNGQKTDRAEVSLQISLATEVLETTPGGDMRIRGEITSGTMKASSGGDQETVPVKSAVLEYLVSARGIIKSTNLVSGQPPAIGVLPYAATPDDVFLVSGVGQLPDKRLKPGDTWEGVARIPDLEGGGTNEWPFKSKLISVGQVRGRPCATIKTTARASDTHAEDAENGSGHVSGRIDIVQDLTWVFDYERSVVMSAQGTTRVSFGMQSTASDSEQSASARISGVMNTRATLLEFNDQKIPTK